MTRKCRHSWELISRRFQPSRLSNFKFYDEELSKLAIFGQTVIVQRCTECGYTDAHTVIGNAST